VLTRSFPVSYIVSLRNPLSVAKSLARRDAFPKTKALWLWLIHNVHIVSETAATSPIVVDYDELMDDPPRQLERVAHFLSLKVKRDVAIVYCSEFLDPALRHTRFSGDDIRADADCDPIVFEVYKELRAQSVTFSPPNPVRWKQKASKWQQSLERISRFLLWDWRPPAPDGRWTSKC